VPLVNLDVAAPLQLDKFDFESEIGELSFYYRAGSRAKCRPLRRRVYLTPFSYERRFSVQEVILLRAISQEACISGYLKLRPLKEYRGSVLGSENDNFCLKRRHLC
jgi:hypothetical protein